MFSSANVLQRVVSGSVIATVFDARFISRTCRWNVISGNGV